METVDNVKALRGAVKNVLLKDGILVG